MAPAGVMNDQSVNKKSYDRNPELVLAFREGDEEAGRMLVEINMPLVYSIAQRFYIISTTSSLFTSPGR